MGTKFYKARNVYSASVQRLSETGKIFIILFFLISGSFSVFSQTSSFSFTQIPMGNNDIISYGRGVEGWNGVSWTNSSGAGVQVPAGTTKSLNSYYRFDWGVEIETSQNIYSWAKFDQQINSAIDNGQMFSFGLMPMCTACSNTGVAGVTYPAYLHTLMQSEASGSQDWKNSDGMWVPNWNSPNYLGRYQALLNAVAAHIASGSHNGKNYKDVIYYVDIRGYGDFGEWHTYPWYGTEPAGRRATSATLKALIDMNLAAFPNYPNVAMVGALNGGGASLTPTDVTYYALTKTNAWGQIGWRRDNWGDPGTTNILNNNPGSYDPGSGSVSFSTVIMNKYKYAPVVGEPDNSMANISKCGSQQCDLSNEIKLYHATSFGNGNFPNPSDPALQTNVVAASKLAGYRLVLNGGNMTTTLTSGGGFSMSLDWQNIGVAPVYENWNVVYELRKSDGTVVWKQNSSFTPKLFIPQGSSTTATDNFTLSAVASGTYSMYLIIRDPLNYKAPLQLGITGRNADGSYLLRSNITVGTGPANKAPTANAGSDLNIQLPTSSVSLAGTGNDTDGSISSWAWTKISGPASGAITTPATAATTVTGLAQGVYKFALTVTDNLGATGMDTVQVTVSPAVANQPPVANAGTDVNITLPVNSVTINGSASSDPDGSISTYLWTKISGPTQYTLGNNTTASTLLSNLTAGSYSFQLKVTDNAGATALDTLKVTVNPGTVNQPPVANAGADQNITLPTNSVTLNGSASSDPDGSISTYLWTNISGPTQYTLGNNTTASTLLSNLTAGSYSFQLKVTDNAGAIALDTIKVTVNPGAVNQPPVANAGTDQNITLPTNSVTLNGSASSDPDGTIATYLWTKISGPAQFTLGNNTTASTLLSNLTAGLYSFQLKVTDNAGAVALDTIKVAVNSAPVDQPPVATAGADQNITLPTNTVTLNGSASSDPDGTITAYLWTNISGPAQFSLANNTSASTLLSNLVAGIYSFQLKVTDNGGAVSLDTIKVNVGAAPANLLPVANAGADISITLPANTANLNGSGSTDPDGTIAGYAWSQISGPASATISTATAVTTGVNGLQQGIYEFLLKVTDNSGAIDLDSVKVSVNAAPNKAPVANAGAGKTITLPVNSVSLDGSLSSDPDGSISAYNWTQVSGPSASTIAGAGSSVATASGMVAGLYTFQLAVTDNAGASTTATVKITVVSNTPQPPIANAGADQTITLPANTVTIDGNASSASAGSIVSYVWTEKSGPSTVSLTNAAANTLNSLQAGVYVFSLTVTDNGGATGTDAVTITVNTAANQAPVANAGSSINLTLPSNSASLDGTKSVDPDGTISTYSWSRISGPNAPGISGANAATANISGLIAGQYIYQLTVTDNNGASSSAQVKIIVSSAANVVPVANAGPNQSIVAPANTVSLNGSASYDSDGTITSYSWITVSGPGSITISNSNTATPSAIGLTTGVYIFELTVTDNRGATAKDQVTIIVDPKPILPNQAPVANAGTNETITIPTNSISLDGTSSFDPDGTISTYAWTQTSGPSSSVIVSGNTATPTVSQLTVGQYVFQLTITDNNGAINTDQVTITVNQGISKVDIPPVADAGRSDTISLPVNTYTLDATGSTDPDGTIASYQWKQISGPNTATGTSMSSPQVTINDLQAGEYEFEVTITDNAGATSAAKMQLTVEPGSSKTNDRFTLFPNPAHQIINGKVTSPITGTVKIYVYDMNGKLVSVTEAEKYSEVLIKSFDVSNLSPGMYTAQIIIANRKTMVAKFIKY